MTLKRGFTLIELLVVIAIIAILAAILFPVFTRAKESAKATQALAQMRQFGISMMMYTSDHDSTFVPSTNYDADVTSPSRIWTVPLFPYVKEKNLFVAPGSTTSKYADSWANRSQQSIGMNSSTGYESVGCLPGDLVTVGCEGFRAPAYESVMELPSQTGLFAVTPDGVPGTKYRGYVIGADNGSTKPLVSLNDARPLVSDRDLVIDPAYSSLAPSLLKPIIARYGADGNLNGRTPIVFGDGHAKSYSAKQIQSGSNIIWRFR